MRTCQSCGKENPDDRDFCSCGEYLRWEPTGFVQAITPEMVQQATAEASQPQAPAEPPPSQSAPAPPPPLDTAPRVKPAEPVRPEPGNGHGNGHAAAPPPPPPPASTAPVPAAPPPPSAPAPIPKIAKTLTHGAVPGPRPPAPPE